MSCRSEPEPPWAAFPWIQAGSIGWRMGVGESYVMEWGEFADTEITGAGDAIAYLRRHPPAPRTWRGWIASWLARLASTGDDDDDDGEPDGSIVEAEGLTEDDAAYPVFVRNAMRDGGMTAPWAWRNGGVSPFDALRYSGRELGWWARWLATECPDRAAHLDAQPAPAPAWAPIARAARTRVAEPAWSATDRSVTAQLCTLAATGTLPPAWLLGIEPAEQVAYDDDATDRDRWHWWVYSVFDDPASWAAYLARWPAPPPGWDAIVNDPYFEG